MKNYKLRIKAIHPYAYKPNGCDTSTATNLYWDADKERICVQLEYDNGAIDWIPLFELNRPEVYEVMNEKDTAKKG